VRRVIHLGSRSNRAPPTGRLPSGSAVTNGQGGTDPVRDVVVVIQVNIQAGDLENPQGDPARTRKMDGRAACIRALTSGDQRTESRRVEESHAGQVDDDVRDIDQGGQVSPQRL
jgi:hypothetical protein